MMHHSLRICWSLLVLLVDPLMKKSLILILACHFVMTLETIGKYNFNDTQYILLTTSYSFATCRHFVKDNSNSSFFSWIPYSSDI